VNLVLLLIVSYTRL